MRIIKMGLESNRIYSKPMCACIGYFDGMHKGHQVLIEKTIEMAKKYHCESALITFDPDPWVTIKHAKDVKHISTMRERLNRAVEYGIQNIIILDFTTEFSQLSPEDFVQQILSKISLKGIVCGFDFHYGAMGKGSAETLKQTEGLEVEVVQPIEDDLGKISSTRITKCIEEGKMQEASKMLGYNFRISGIVVHGRNKGHSIGFPTANLQFDPEYILPRTGVYTGFVIIQNERYKAMINLGHNPTFNLREDISLEANIFDFNRDIYGKFITIEFIEFVREEKKFSSKGNLIMQLEQDIVTIKKKLKNYE
jgi:riboflavin kinase / FMN adenylyltransferase